MVAFSIARLLPAATAAALLALGGCSGGFGVQTGSPGDEGGSLFHGDNSQLGELHDDWLHSQSGPFPDNGIGGGGGGGGDGGGGSGHR